MSKRFVSYDTTTGRIKAVGMVQDVDITRVAGIGESYLEDVLADEHTQYVVSGNVVSRPNSNIVLDKTTPVEDETIHFTNIPVNTEVRVNMVFQAVVVDGLLNVTFSTAGVYFVEMINFPYVDYKVSITCS